MLAPKKPKSNHQANTAALVTAALAGMLSPIKRGEYTTNRGLRKRKNKLQRRARRITRLAA